MSGRQQVDPDSPNRKIDRALNKMMDRILKDEDTTPDDVAIKIIGTAVNWEKVKARINGDDNEFNADNL